MSVPAEVAAATSVAAAVVVEVAVTLVAAAQRLRPEGITSLIFISIRFRSHFVRRSGSFCIENPPQRAERFDRDSLGTRL